MISYTDYVLSSYPYCYYRWDDEPRKSGNISLHIDTSGNKKHNEFTYNPPNTNFFSANRFSSFNDVLPFGGFFNNHNSYTMWVPGTSIPLGTSFSSPSITLPFDVIPTNERPLYQSNRVSKPGFFYSTKDTNFRVEFLISGNILTGTPTCNLSGLIMTEAFTIGPFNFQTSQLWDPPICDKCCSSMADDPPSIHVFLLRTRPKINSLGNVVGTDYIRTHLFRLIVVQNNDVQPNMGNIFYGNSFFPINVDEEGLFKVDENETSWLKDYRYIIMKNVVPNISFNAYLENLSFNYIFAQPSFIFIPIKRIYKEDEEIVIETLEPHNLEEGRVINRIENIDSTSFFNRLNIPILEIKDFSKIVISKTSENPKLFPNYWYASYDNGCMGETYMSWDGSNYVERRKLVNWKNPIWGRRMGFVKSHIRMYFANPYFIKQEEDRIVNTVETIIDQNGNPDTRLRVNFNSPHNFSNNDLVQFFTGVNGNEVWNEEPFRVVVDSATSIIIPFRRTACTKLVLHTNPIQINYIKNNKNEDETEINFGTLSFEVWNSFKFKENNRLFIIRKRKGRNNLFGDFDRLKNPGYFVDIKSSDSTLCSIFVDYEQIKKFESITRNIFDKHPYNYMEPDLFPWAINQPIVFENSPGHFAVQCIKYKNVISHFHNSHYTTISVSSLIKEENDEWVMISAQPHNLIPSISFMIRVDFPLLNPFIAFYPIEIIDANTVRMTTAIHHSGAPGEYAQSNTQWYLWETRELGKYSFIEVEFDTQEEIDNLPEQLNFFDWNANFELYSDYPIRPRTDKSLSLIMRVEKIIAENLKNFTSYPFVGTINSQDFPFWNGNNDVVVRPIKRLFEESSNTTIQHYPDVNLGTGQKLNIIGLTDEEVEELMSTFPTQLTFENQYVVNHHAPFYESSLQKTNGSFDNSSNTLTLRTNTPHGLTTGDKIKLQNVQLFSSDFYPIPALGNEPNKHVYELGFIPNEYPNSNNGTNFFPCIKTNKPIFEYYEENSTNTYFFNIGSSNFEIVNIINKINNDIFEITVIDSHTFSLVIEDSDSNIEYYNSDSNRDLFFQNHISFSEMCLRIDFKHDFTKTIEDNFQNHLFTLLPSHGLLEDRRLYVNVGSDAPGIDQGNTDIKPTEGISLLHYLIPDESFTIPNFDELNPHLAGMEDMFEVLGIGQAPIINKFKDHRFIIEWEYGTEQEEILITDGINKQSFENMFPGYKDHPSFYTTNNNYFNGHKMQRSYIDIRIFIDGNDSNGNRLIVYRSRKYLNQRNEDFSQINDALVSTTNQSDINKLHQNILNLFTILNGERFYNSASSMEFIYRGMIEMGGLSMKIGQQRFHERPVDYIDIIEPIESWAILNDDTRLRHTLTIDDVDDIDKEFPEYTDLTNMMNHCDILTKVPQSLEKQFDSFMLIGSDQIRLKRIEFEEIEEDYNKIHCIFGNEYFNHSLLKSNFKIGDWVQLGMSKQKELNRKWKIQEIHENSIVFYTTMNFLNENCSQGVVMVKRLAVRETGSWHSHDFTWEKWGSIYTSFEKNFQFFINDTAVETSTQPYQNPQGATNTAIIGAIGIINSGFLKRNMKDNFQIFSEIRTNSSYANKVNWRVIGSPLQIHFVIEYGRDSLSHQQLFTIGHIRDMITNEWESIFQAYNVNHYGYPGHNYSFLFANFELLDSGHILCRNYIEGEPNSDAQFIIAANNQFTKKPSKKDLGIHIYPAPFVSRDITLPYIEEPS